MQDRWKQYGAFWLGTRGPTYLGTSATTLLALLMVLRAPIAQSQAPDSMRIGALRGGGAAGFLAAEWQDAGQQTVPRFAWSYGGTTPNPRSSEVVLYGCTSTRALRVGKDAAVMGGRGPAISAPLVLSDTAMSTRGRSLLDAAVVILDNGSTPFATAHQVIGRARAIGAAAVVVVASKSVADSSMLVMADAGARMDHSAAGVPVVVVTRAVWDELFPDGNSCGGTLSLRVAP